MPTSNENKQDDGVRIVIDEQYVVHEPVKLEVIHLHEMRFKFQTEKYCCEELKSSIDLIFSEPHMVQCHRFNNCPYCGTKINWYAASSKVNDDLDEFQVNKKKELELNAA